MIGSAALALVLILGVSLGYWHFGGILPRTGEEAREIAPASTPAESGALPAVAEAREGSAGTESDTADAGAPTSDAGPEEAAATSDGPSFELLRVDPDGQAVVAGVALPGSQVLLRRAGQVIAQDTAGAGGDFAMMLDEALPVGDHTLQLESQGEGGETTLSAQTAIVSVPPRGRESELMVMIETTDAPSQLLVTPTPQVARAAPEALPVSEQTVVASAPQGDISQAPAPMAAAPVESVAAPIASARPLDLAIAAVEIEDERIYVAGTRKPGSTVRIYVDDAFVAEAERGESAEFLASAQAEVPTGSRIVRADEIDAAGDVVSRVEVPFERPEGRDVSALAVPAVDGEDAPVQAALEPVEGRVIIRRGDTLWRISRDTYGRGARYTVIYLANGDQIRDPDLIYPGQIFRMPQDETAAAGG
ncbi:LysM peptidoglycan-binding domain-containing protein [Aureimonas mangrovi]|uniref:LysM peptidoglycan-binding domain-containing protein n=1 Tax=Aureimonas mangrovi TaxID=2758041 RepID=UPI00163DD803|nr:LysM peptidoglycan-binding domain-containing protein [Aureimonas mangrovi]